MRMQHNRVATFAATAIAAGILAGCATDRVNGPRVSPAERPSFALASWGSWLPGPKVPPTTAFPGNFVASDDDQICYQIFASISEGTPSGELFGAKVENPAAGSSGTSNVGGVTVDWQTSPDGRHMAFETSGGRMLAVVVKGGTNYWIYNYAPAGQTIDYFLRSPLQGRNIPAISHFNVCVAKDDFDAANEGCTPGYWRNHANRWAGALPSQSFNIVFGVSGYPENTLLNTYSLGQAIWGKGGGIIALARHATAAYLNSLGGTPNPGSNPPVTVTGYAYTTDQVLQMVKDALDNDAATGLSIEATKDLFAAANEAGCPLANSSAVAVPQTQAAP